MKLTKKALVREAELFCARESSKNHPELYGINDGKSLGTFIEHEFKKYLENKYEFSMNSSSEGIDFPDEEINTDLKVTSSKKPQNSCPFRDIKQKIYGLGYNLLLFIYSKKDEEGKSFLTFESCTFIESDETGDYNLTKNLIQMVDNGWTKEKIMYYLEECNLPCDKTTLSALTDEIMKNPPKQGYLTISNAFQWRIKYNHKDKKEDLPTYSKKEYGDYQTPVDFCNEVLSYAVDNFKIEPDIIIEPTCGIGNFINASKAYFPESRKVGIDINRKYLQDIRSKMDDVELYEKNIFEFDFNDIIQDDYGEYMIIGNPPWVTNTNLSKLNSKNAPIKNNFKNYNQFEAKTGMSNFDVSENIILHIIENFRKIKSTIIFLCKYNVACNIFEYMAQNRTMCAEISIIKFNAMKVFRIDAAASILIIQFNKNNKNIQSCRVNSLENPYDYYSIGFKNGKLYSNMDNDIDLDGKCLFEWRQGIKHDCVKVMELKKDYNGSYKNKKDDDVKIEDSLLYPLLKSSNLKKAIVNKSSQKIIVTQRRLKEDTSYIKDEYPLTWDYLIENREYFERRKSSIYRNAPLFSIFGVGDYTFKKYKVAISGFYKEGLFCLVYDDKGMMLDDTCYYISFDEYDDAYITMLVLNSDVVQIFLKNITFLDSKRPYTKRVLKRIDMKKAVKLLKINDLTETEKKLGLEEYVTCEKYESYCERYFLR